MVEIAERFSLPGEAVGAMRLSMVGYGRLLLENRGALLEFSREQITLAKGTELLRIRGDGLHLEAMDGESLIIRGRIMGIELE